MKNTQKAQLLFSGLVVLLLSGCEKVIDLDLKEEGNKIVIEGEINNGSGPYSVHITQSVPFTQSSIYPVIDDAFVVLHDDAGQRDTLQLNPEGFYQTKQIKGIPGRTYTLDVSIAGTTYSASSKMPNPVNLDMLNVTTFEFLGEVQKAIVPIYTDPLEIGNSYRKIMYVNNQLDKIWEISNDNVNNGGTNQQPIFGSTFELATGDNVKVVLQCIDPNVYNYFFTLSEISDGGPGGGITPTNPPNNFSGGVLGIFSACSVSEKSIVVD
jgi:hypothetical protein